MDCSSSNDKKGIELMGFIIDPTRVELPVLKEIIKKERIGKLAPFNACIFRDDHTDQYKEHTESYNDHDDNYDDHTDHEDYSDYQVYDDSYCCTSIENPLP